MTDHARITVGSGEIAFVGARAAVEARALMTAAVAAEGGGLAPPAQLHASAATGRSTLFWTPAPGAAAYYVLRPGSPAGASYPQDALDRTTGLMYIDTGVESGATYYYAVVSESADQRISGPSEIREVRIEAPPPPPVVRPERPSVPGWDPSWTPKIGEPPWSGIDVIETRLLSLIDIGGPDLRTYVLASLSDELPFESGLTRGIIELRDRGVQHPWIGLTLDAGTFRDEIARRPDLIGELRGLADDLGHLDVGLAIRLEE